MIEFPTSPAPQQGQIYTVAGKSWKWNGTSWEAVSGSSSSGPVTWDNVTGKPSFGTAALTNTSEYATAAQGLKADSALQPNAAISSISGLQAELDGKATAAQGAKADTASQPGHTHATSDITGFATAAASAAPVQSVAGRVGAVTLTLSDIGQSAATGGQVATWNSTLGAWVPQTPAAGGVTSVNTRTGAVTLTISDVPGAVSSSTTGMTGATALTNIVQITQSGYNALGASVNANTLYIIVG